MTFVPNVTSGFGLAQKMKRPKYLILKQGCEFYAIMEKGKPEVKRDFGRRYPNGKSPEKKDRKETRREKKFRKKDRCEGRGKRLRAKARQEGRVVDNGRESCRVETIRFTVN